MNTDNGHPKILEPTEILFQIKTDKKEDLEIFEDGIIPWISIKNPKAEIPNLIGKDDLVLNAEVVTLVIDYPLKKPVSRKLISGDPKGFTRAMLIEKISEQYHLIYKEEEETAQVKTVPMVEREGIINRNTTNGKYGIWGHDIDDLVLDAVVVRKNESRTIVLELMISS